MLRLTQSFLISAVLFAAPSWQVKAPTEWTRLDATQVLTHSPWVVKVQPAVLPQRSVAQRRDGGKTGGGHAIGLDQLGASSLTGFGGNKPSRRKAAPAPLEVRWESSRAVRMAEVKVGEADFPKWDGDYYAVAVYDIAGLTEVDEKTLPSELKKEAYLKRAGKKDLRPVRVEVVLLESNLARVTYLFPRTEVMTAADQQIGFIAQIGRLYVAYNFATNSMQLQGKLEL